jgi:hypothetical protein
MATNAQGDQGHGRRALPRHAGSQYAPVGAGMARGRGGPEPPKARKTGHVRTRPGGLVSKRQGLFIN